MHRTCSIAEALESRRLMATTYTLLDLAPSQVIVSNEGDGISRVSNSHLAGTYITNSFDYRGELYAGTATFVASLNPVTGRRDAKVIDLSDTGTAVGVSEAGGSDIATAWVGSATPVNLGAGKANGISRNAAYIVGQREVATSQPNVFADHAFIFGKKAKDLGTLGGATSQSEANDVNNAGIVVGRSDDSVGRSLPFYHNGRGMYPIKFNFENGEANAVNDKNIVVGQVESQAFSFNIANKAIKVLQPASIPGGIGISEALDINNSGVIVGYSQGGSDNYATVWEGGLPFDLNKLIPAGSGYHLTFAKSINDKGQILAVGTVNGQGRAVLLSPNLSRLDSNGTLRINGSPVADVVGISLKSNRVVVTINGGTQKFVASSVKRLSVDLGEGSDKLTMTSGVPYANIYGRGGNDQFFVRNGKKDIIDGGTGSDKGQFDSSDSRTSIETILA